MISACTTAGHDGLTSSVRSVRPAMCESVPISSVISSFVFASASVSSSAASCYFSFWALSTCSLTENDIIALDVANFCLCVCVRGLCPDFDGF